jgi:hypothetical protein
VDRTLSWLAGAHNPDATERALTEIDAAIAMVARGIAVSVRLCNLPAADETAFDAAARAQAVSVAFRLVHDGQASVTMIIGPRGGDRRSADETPGDTRPEASA